MIRFFRTLWRRLTGLSDRMANNDAGWPEQYNDSMADLYRYQVRMTAASPDRHSAAAMGIEGARCSGC